MLERVRALGAAVTRSSVHAGLGLERTVAQLGERRITIVRTGIGPVSAALALSFAQEREPADAVILLGVGGALRPELVVGDLAVSTHVLQHDYFYSFEKGDRRIRAGALILSSEEARGHVAEIAADPALVDWISRAEAASRVFRGPVLSGNEFVGRAGRKRELAALVPGALLVDMEAAGVAQVASRLGVPFVVAKTVADRLDPEVGIERDFRVALEAACGHAAAAVSAVLAGSSGSPTPSPAPRAPAA